MNVYAKLAAAAVVVVAVGALGAWFLSPGSSSAPVGGTPAESASPAAIPPSSASPVPSRTTSPLPTTPPLSGNFTSTLHGISLATPAEWTTQPATEAWDGRPFPNYGDPDVDLILDPVHRANLWLMVASKPLEAADPDQWPADQLTALECVTVPVSVDGATGLIGATFDRTDCSAAFFASSGRGCMIRLYDSTAFPAMPERGSAKFSPRSTFVPRMPSSEFRHRTYHPRRNATAVRCLRRFDRTLLG